MNSEQTLVDKIHALYGGKNNTVFATPPPIFTAPPKDFGGNDGRNDGKLPELRSEAVNEVMNQPPAWLIQWGISVLFAILVLLLAIAWWVKYPELIKGNLRILSVNIPKSIQAKAEGRLVLLLAKDGQQATTGQVLGLVENTADYQEVLLLEQKINGLIQLAIQNQFAGIEAETIPLFFQLGDLQKPFQSFQENFIKSKAFLSQGVFSKKRSVLEEDLTTLQKLKTNLQNQLRLQESELNLTREQLESQQRLEQKGYASKIDVRNTTANYLTKKQAFEQAKNGLDNNQLSQNQKAQDVIELEKNIVDQKNSLIQSITTLKSDIEAWKQRFLLKAPTTGKVVFINNLQENMTLKMGQDLLFVQPEGEGYYGEMKLGQFNLGKLKIKQEVIVKLSSYPYQEFGIVRAEVKHISDLPNDSLYTVKIAFPQALITDYNKQIPFKNGMTASAEIVTANRSLFDRFFSELVRFMR